eukprot:scaffold6088_cov128-Isochrysis_galbana.AAC.5
MRSVRLASSDCPPPCPLSPRPLGPLRPLLRAVAELRPRARSAVLRGAVAAALAAARAADSAASAADSAGGGGGLAFETGSIRFASACARSLRALISASFSPAAAASACATSSRTSRSSSSRAIAARRRRASAAAASLPTGDGMAPARTIPCSALPLVSPGTEAGSVGEIPPPVRTEPPPSDCMSADASSSALRSASAAASFGFGFFASSSAKSALIRPSLTVGARGGPGRGDAGLGATAEERDGTRGGSTGNARPAAASAASFCSVARSTG